jgi:hypothetical protein
MPFKSKEKRAAYSRAYVQTPGGKAAIARYATSAKGRATKARNSRSPARKAYRALPSSKAWWKAYRQTVSGKRACAVGQAKYRRSKKGKAYLKAGRKAYHARHPDYQRVHNAFNQKIRSGRIARQPCEVCGSIPSQGHHPDYSKPLEVQWLCRKHHQELHSITVKEH